MKVATKFALAFMASAAFSIVVYSAAEASQAVEQLEVTVAEDLASVGRTLRTSVLSVWENEGEARALELVERQDAASASETIDVYLAWLDVDATNPRWPRGGSTVIPSLLRGEQATWITEKPNGSRVIYVYVPLIRPGARPSALEISRPMVGESHLFWRSLRAQLVAATTVAAIAVAFLIALAWWLVSAPLARLTEQARRIGAGDFSHRVKVRGTDEVARLANELNAMADQLLESRSREKDATEKRVTALEQLRHADRLRTVGTLASGIAHELGTPLNVIAMRAKMIATGEVPAEESAANAKIIVTQTDRVTKIVRQLLDFARRRPPNRAEVDLGDLADRTAQLLAALAKKARVDVEVKRDEPVRARVDASQIEQAITNLVINAVHAMPEGGKVTVTAKSARSRDRNCAVLEVADTGSGIPEESLDRIFEPFFTTKPVGDGTGLGLSVTHGIIEDHEGWMEVQSDIGKGSTFKLYLPVE